jgi:cytochrome b561
MSVQAQAGQSYTGIAKTLHWLILILLALMIYGGWAAEELKGADRLTAMQGHAGLGIVLLILMLFRLVWRITHPAPALPSDMPHWQQIAATATHHSLYFLVILQPLMGLAMTMTSTKGSLRPFGLFGLQVAPNEIINGIARDVHGVLPVLIIALVAVHAVAALYHHFVRHDNVLKRMLPFTKV